MYTCKSHHKSPIGKTVICDKAHALFAEDAGSTLPPLPLVQRVADEYPSLPPMYGDWDESQSMTAHIEKYGGKRDIQDLPVPF